MFNWLKDHLRAMEEEKIPTREQLIYNETILATRLGAITIEMIVGLKDDIKNLKDVEMQHYELLKNMITEIHHAVNNPQKVGSPYFHDLGNLPQATEVVGDE